MKYMRLLRLFFVRLFSSSAKRKKFVYVALGDSTVEGYGASSPERGYTGIVYKAVKEAYPHAVFYNLGVGNATIADVLQKQMQQAIALHPDLITISIGGNDIRFRTPTKIFKNSLTILLQTLSQETKAEIVINTIPDFSLLPAVPKHLKMVSKLFVMHLNRAIISLSHSYHIILVDLYTQGRIFTKYFPEVIFEDGFHPSDFGYALWANSVLHHIQHILFPSSFLV